MYMAIALIVLTAFCGLAVDATVLFLIRAKLSAAVDAAALAGARSVNLGTTQAAAQSAALGAAQSFFVADYPSGYLGSTPINMSTQYTATFTQSASTGLITVAITANVEAPVYFMRILGFTQMPVSAAGTATRRALVMMLALDVSSSMGNGAGSSCEAMIAAAQNFVTMFSPYDEIGLITFNLTATLNDAPTTSHGVGSALYNDIGAISCGSNTNTIAALETAYAEIKAAGLPLALNTIVLFTDGSPNAVTANFPARASVDTRWGPAMAAPAPPAQPGGYSCVDTGANGQNPNPPNTDNNEEPCQNMPVVCTNASATIFGSIAQWGDQNSYGASTYGPANPTNTLSASIPASCNDTGGLPSTNIRQFVAYIPNSDYWGNNLQHGVPVTAASPAAAAEVLSGWDTRENWLFQVNQDCNPPGTCKNTGAVWLPTYSGTGSGSNFFSAGPYKGYLRPDQPNTIVAASMNGAMSAAYNIRSDSTYNPVIDTIYLTGNSYDSVDHEFLAIMANVQQITALPYDSTYSSTGDPALYANPAYQSGQQMGEYLVTSDKNQLTTLFAQLASQVLRLSQ
jgi:Flp pilus assembly protein TadG